MKEENKVILLKNNSQFITLIIVIVIAGGISYLVAKRETNTASTTTKSIGPTVRNLEGLSELAALKDHVKDIITAEGEGYRGSWLIKGDALMACELSKSEIIQKDEKGQVAVIRLPYPRVISARVDHEKTKTWSVEKSTWLPWRWGDQDAMRDSAMFHAQKLIERAASSQDAIEDAKARTELLIRKFFEPMGWTVRVEWIHSGHNQPRARTAEELAF